MGFRSSMAECAPDKRAIVVRFHAELPSRGHSSMAELPALNRQIAGSIPRAPTNFALERASPRRRSASSRGVSDCAVNQLVEIPACHAG